MFEIFCRVQRKNIMNFFRYLIYDAYSISSTKIGEKMSFRFKRMRFLILTFLSMCFCSVVQGDDQAPYRLLVIGCGRSGTAYMSKLMQSYGLRIGHEKVLKDGVSSWIYTIERDEFAKKENYDLVIHQIRNPLNVISSWVRNNIDRDWAWNMITEHVPEIDRNESLLQRSAKYWYYWNLKAEEKADWSYRIEDIDKILPMLIDYFNLRQISKPPPKNYNRRRKIKKRISWEDLRMVLNNEDFENIQSLAAKYGYPIE